MAKRKQKPLTKRALEKLTVKQAARIVELEDDAKRFREELRRLWDEQHQLSHEVQSFREVNEVRPDLIAAARPFICAPGCARNPWGK